MYKPSEEDLRNAREVCEPAPTAMAMVRSLTEYAQNFSQQYGLDTKEVLTGLLTAGVTYQGTLQSRKP